MTSGATDADPRLAAAIATHEAVAAATVGGDRDVFMRHCAPELLVNSPADRVLPAAGVAKAFEAGMIAYESSETTVEHASVRANGEVLLMGSEAVIPRPPSPLAGRRVTYRFSEIWRPDGEGWLLSVRQATIRRTD